MILRFITLILAIHAFGGLDPLKTRNANQAKEKAEKAIAANDFKTAIDAYNYLLDTLKIKDDKALLNLAHAYMRKADYNNATSRYTEAAKSADMKIRSVASQQLGILQSEKGNREEALSSFKNAIKYDPSNTQARFNYELMMKNKNKDIPKSQDQKQRQEEKKNQEKKERQKKEQDQKEQDKKGEQENKEPGKGDKKEDGEKQKGEKESEEGKEGEKNEQKKKEEGKSGKNKEGEDNKEKGKESNKNSEDQNKSSRNKEDEKSKEKGTAEKPGKKGEQKKNTETPDVTVNKEQLQKMNMTEHQAKALLNAMRQGEVQYIQQMKRSGKYHNEKHKKDW